MISIELQYYANGSLFLKLEVMELLPYTFFSSPENSQTISLTKDGNILVEKLNMKGIFSCNGDWKLFPDDYISLASECNQFDGSNKINYFLKEDTLVFIPLCREGCSSVYKAVK